MIEEFFRRIIKEHADEYRTCVTFSEKINSEFITNLIDESESYGISVFKTSTTITIDRIIVAITARRREPGTISFLTFKDCLVKMLEETDGNTPDDEVNKSHYDFKKLSKREIVELADCMINNNTVERYNQNDILQVVKKV